MERSTGESRSKLLVRDIFEKVISMLNPIKYFSATSSCGRDNNKRQDREIGNLRVHISHTSLQRVPFPLQISSSSLFSHLLQRPSTHSKQLVQSTWRTRLLLVLLRLSSMRSRRIVGQKFEGRGDGRALSIEGGRGRARREENSERTEKG